MQVHIDQLTVTPPSKCALSHATIESPKARDAASNIIESVQDPIVAIGCLGPPTTPPEVCFELRRCAGGLRCRMRRRWTSRIESTHRTQIVTDYKRTEGRAH
jgi:hypothetical protein